MVRSMRLELIRLPIRPSNVRVCRFRHDRIFVNRKRYYNGCRRDCQSLLFAYTPKFLYFFEKMLMYNRAMKRMIIFLLCIMLAALPCAGCAQAADDVWILFVNAKKGDAALISANGKFYLVDTGREENADALVSTLKEYGVDEIEGLFLTHSHNDHTGGLKAVAEAFTIRAAYRAEFAEANKKGQAKLDKKLGKVGLESTILRAGDRISLGGDAYAEVLAPTELNGDDDNDNSLVLMLHANGHRALFTGDMQFREERTLLRRNADVSADILKVGNHGNPDATLEEFADAVGAGIAVISTDTSADADSANARVIAALGEAQVFVTENDPIGVMIGMGKDISAGYASIVNNY